MAQELGACGPDLKCNWTGRVGWVRGPPQFFPVLPKPPRAPLVLPKPDTWQPESHLPSPQSKNYKAVCLELKPEPIKVRSFFDAIPASRPETHGEVTWSQGSFAIPGGQDFFQVLADTQKRERALCCHRTKQRHK